MARYLTNYRCAVKKTFAVIVVCLCVGVSHAGLWERQVDKAFENTWAHGGQTAREGYSYRAGVGFSRPQRPSDVAVDWEYDMGLGCAGFDLSADFLELMNTRALTNYLQGQLAAAIQAAPSLLLAYISPTLYDVVKSFEARAGELQLLRYRQCQEILEAGEDWVRKSREAGRRDQLEEARKEGVPLSEAIASIPETSPFAGKRDYDGNLLGTMRLVRDGLKWAGADDELVKLGPEIAGDYVMSYDAIREKSDVRFIRAVKTTDALLTENTEQFLSDLELAISEYRRNEVISKDTLRKLSVPSVPMVPAIIKAIDARSDFDKHLLSSMLSSNLSVTKTAWQMRQIAEGLRQAMYNPYLDEGQKEVLLRFIGDLERNRRTMLKDAELEDRLASNRIGERIMGGWMQEMDQAVAETEITRAAQGHRERSNFISSSPTGMAWFE